MTEILTCRVCGQMFQLRDPYYCNCRDADYICYDCVLQYIINTQNFQCALCEKTFKMSWPVIRAVIMTSIIISTLMLVFLLVLLTISVAILNYPLKYSLTIFLLVSLVTLVVIGCGYGIYRLSRNILFKILRNL